MALYSPHFQSIEQVVSDLADAQYIADRALATVLFLANRLEKPIFLEGEPGVGKTEIAIVMARLLDTDIIRLQCYEGLDASTSLYEWNYPKLLLYIRMCEQDHKRHQDIDHLIYSPPFLVKRPLLEAIEHADGKVPVLLIDEIDRADEEFEAFLLEVLSDFQITIPEIGTIKAKKKPVVIITSNRTRDVHDAPKRRLKRLVIIADVSGSMDRYTCLLIPFILGLKGIGSRAEAFVFSTTLTSVTFHPALFVEDALRKMSLEVPNWSGGTNIGESLRQFNREHGQRLLNSRTVVVILSDGWDLWPEILRRELSLLSSKVHRVVWLNPELGQPDSPIVAQGMVAALPYIDYFMPADNLESLKRVGRVLTQVMIH